MPKVTQIEVPQGSLLAGFGGPGDYRDCFARDVPGEVSLPAFIESFYCSMAFRPERLALGLIGRNTSSADARALARGEIDHFGVWTLAERQIHQALYVSKPTGTASWFAVEPASSSSGAVGQKQTPSSSAAVERTDKQTRLLFGSWVDNLDQSGWRFMQGAHVWYSRMLLGGVRP